MTFVLMSQTAKEGIPKGGSGNRARGRANARSKVAIPLVTDGVGSYPQMGVAVSTTTKSLKTNSAGQHAHFRNPF
jgi:hypothetical protein